MRIILSPAKKMREDPDGLAPTAVPAFLEKTEQIQNYLAGLTFEEQKKLWACNDNIALLNARRHGDIQKNPELLRNLAQLTPAILAYDGIAFQYMAPSVFEAGQFDYVQEHLRILSAYYGCLKPLDGVTPYRLEMQAKAKGLGGEKNLYDFWGNTLYEAVRDDSGVFINLASKEYSKCIERFLTPEDTYITCTFGELAGEKVVTKGVYAKMARGEMVRFLAEQNTEDPEAMQQFDRLNFTFHQELSTDTDYIFLRECN